MIREVGDRDGVSRQKQRVTMLPPPVRRCRWQAGQRTETPSPDGETTSVTIAGISFGAIEALQARRRHTGCGQMGPLVWISDGDCPHREEESCG